MIANTSLIERLMGHAGLNSEKFGKKIVEELGENSITFKEISSAFDLKPQKEFLTIKRKEFTKEEREPLASARSQLKYLCKRFDEGKKVLKGTGAINHNVVNEVQSKIIDLKNIIESIQLSKITFLEKNSGKKYDYTGREIKNAEAK